MNRFIRKIRWFVLVVGIFKIGHIAPASGNLLDDLKSFASHAANKVKNSALKAGNRAKTRLKKKVSHYVQEDGDQSEGDLFDDIASIALGDDSDQEEDSEDDTSDDETEEDDDQSKGDLFDRVSHAVKGRTSRLSSALKSKASGLSSRARTTLERAKSRLSRDFEDEEDSEGDSSDDDTEEDDA